MKTKIVLVVLIIFIVIVVASYFYNKKEEEMKREQQRQEAECRGDVWFRTKENLSGKKVSVNKGNGFEQFSLDNDSHLLVKKSETQNYSIKDNQMFVKTYNNWQVMINMYFVEEVCLQNTFGKTFLNLQ